MFDFPELYGWLVAGAALRTCYFCGSPAPGGVVMFRRLGTAARIPVKLCPDCQETATPQEVMNLVAVKARAAAESFRAVSPNMN